MLIAAWCCAEWWWQRSKTYFLHFSWHKWEARCRYSFEEHTKQVSICKHIQLHTIYGIYTSAYIYSLTLNLHFRYTKIVDEAINRVVSTWQENPYGNLTAQDIFYVRICKFQEIFQALSDLADNRIESQQQTTTLAMLISDINSITLHIIAEIKSSREHNGTLYTLPQEKANVHEYLPWTAMSGGVGLRDTLSHLIDISVRYGAHCTNEPELKQRLYRQIYEIIDTILDGRKHYLESVHDSEKYNVLLQQFESQRRELISILSK